MAIVNIAFNPADCFQGPCEIYLDVLAPPSAVPPVAGTNTLLLDQFGQPTIGATGQIATVTVGAGGSGYTVGDTLTVVQSGGSFGMVRVATLSTTAVATVIVIKTGEGYAVAAGLATTGGSGTGCTITIATITSGFHLGLSEGPSTFSETPKFNEIMADQFSTPVDAAYVSNACEIDIVIKETTLQNMQRMFAGLFSATLWTLAAGSTNPARTLITIGSTNTSTALTKTILLVGPRKDKPNAWLYILAYKAYIASAVQISLGRSKESQWKLKWKCLADVTRVAQDYAAQIVKVG